MKEELALIKENTCIAADVFRMVLKTSAAREASCGQFVQVQVPGYFLRRPISICEIKDEDTLVLVYKVVGDGTRVMSTMAAGDKVSIFGPLGSGFPVIDRDVLLIGGGVGVPPLLETAKRYISAGHQAAAVLGFNDESSIMLEEDFRQVGCKVYIATMDGSRGTKGTVMDAIRENGIEETFVLSCGPVPMLRAVDQNYSEGYISLESRMACGFGACMGCVVKDRQGEALRVCREGPVFEIGKVVLA